MNILIEFGALRGDHVSIWIIAPTIRRWPGIRHLCKILMSSDTIDTPHSFPSDPTSTTTGKWRIIQKNMIPLNGTYPLHQREKSSARWHHWQVYWAAGSRVFYRGSNCALQTYLGRRHPLCGMAWFIPNQAQLHLCLHKWFVYLTICSSTYLAWGSQTLPPDRVLAPPNIKG